MSLVTAGRQSACLFALLACGITQASESERRYSILLVGNPAGEQRSTYHDDGSVHIEYSFTDRGRGPDLTARYRLDKAGVPVTVAIEGTDYMAATVNETFAADESGASWKSTADLGESDRAGFYVSLDGPPEESALLARALQAAPGQQLDLLPSGRAHLETVESIELDDGRSIRHVEIHGLGFEPEPLWIDADGRLFALVSSWFSVIEAGHEDLLDRLGARQEDRQAQRFAAMTGAARIPLPDRLVIDNARIVDVRAGRIRNENAVVVEGGRITQLLPPDAPRPDGARRIDAGGQTLLPGLWDMHTHLSLMDGPLNMANGVTTVRDLANDHDELLRIIDLFETGRAVGPAVLRAGIIDGDGEFAGPTPARISDAAGAARWIDFYADEGYQQIKIYSSVPVPLVADMAARARERGLRVSGHIPAGMWAEDAVRAGYDEIQHINMVFLNFYKDVTETRNPDRFIKVAERGADLDVDSEEFRDFVALLRANDVAVDPTVAIFFDMFTQVPGEPKLTQAAIHASLPSQVARQSLKGGLAVPPGERERYAASARRMLDVIAALHAADVQLLAGTDALAGFALHSEMNLYADAGIPPMDVLGIATLESARVMGADNEVGAVEPGLRADLILVDGRPDKDMSQIRRVTWVMRDGVAYDPAVLRELISIAPLASVSHAPDGADELVVMTGTGP